MKKFQRGKRSTIRRQLTEEEIKKGDATKEVKQETTEVEKKGDTTKEAQETSETEKSGTTNEETETTEKKITRKRGSTLRRKFPLNKTDSRTSISSRTSQISEVGPDGIHYKPGFV